MIVEMSEDFMAQLIFYTFNDRDYFPPFLLKTPRRSSLEAAFSEDTEVSALMVLRLCKIKCEHENQHAFGQKVDFKVRKALIYILTLLST